MAVDKPEALAEVLAWLDTLDPITRARMLGALLDTRNAAVLSGRRVAAIHEATWTRTYAEVAAEVGVSVSAIGKAVSQRKATLRAAGR
jgi:hypothetical protein